MHDEPGNPPSDDGRVTASEALRRTLLREIERDGPVTFARFVETVLYHPSHGYYSADRRPWGSDGDYVTTPQVGAAVGRSLAGWVVEVDDVLGRPAELAVVEVGSGDGSLLRDLRTALRERRPGTADRARWLSVERSAALRGVQRRRLGRPASADVEWFEDVGRLPTGLVGCVYSNELVDALPFHRVTVREGALREIYVGAEGGELVDVVGPPSTPRIAAYLDRNGVDLREGQRAEVRLAARPWLKRVAEGLERGFVLTIDYGGRGDALYGAHRMEGTLACHRRYRVHDDPYRQLGGQDITAHVDFANLARVGREVGLRDLGYTSLRVFLLGFGAAEELDVAATDPPGWRRRLALRHLLVSEVGDAHRVLLQGRGVGDSPMTFGRERLDAELERAAGTTDGGADAGVAGPAARRKGWDR